MISRAIVVAAGKGNRIWPYGEFRQKCVLPVANVPAVRRTCESLRELGVAEIVVVVGHHKQQVIGAVGDVEGVRFHERRELDGTATAAYAAQVAFGDDSDALVIYGDIVTTKENIGAFVSEFERSGLEASALLATLAEEDASNWLCASFSNGLLRDVKGHPRGGSHRLCGVYAFRASAFDALRRHPGIAARVDVGGMPPVEAEIAGSLQVMLDEGRDIFAMEAADFFVDLDKPWHLLEANGRMARHLCERVDRTIIADGAEISDGAEIDGYVVVGRNTSVGKRVVIRGNAIIGANGNVTNGAIIKGGIVVGNHCRISDYCEIGGESVVGNRCVIGHGAEFGGVMFDKVYLYHYCEMWGVFGEATDIGAATVCGTLRFDDRDSVHRVQGRAETPPYGANAIYIGDFCRTGVNAILMPGVKIGSYSCVGPGVILYEDVDSKTLLLAKQELVRKPWGPERYGW